MWSYSLILLALLGVSSAIPQPKISALRRPGWRPHRRQLPFDSTDTSSSSPTVLAPKDNIWNSLSNDEAADVIAFLHSKNDLNLTAQEDAGSWDNTIMVVDLLPPNKTDALNYFDGDGDKPERWAIASLLFGATEEPYAQDWVVGPIPTTENSTYYPYTFGTHAHEAKIRSYDMDGHYGMFTRTAMSMKDIVNDLLNATIDTEEDFYRTFDLWGIDPLWHEKDDEGNDHVIDWIGFWRYPGRKRMDNGTMSFDGETLLPQGIYMQFDITGRDKSKWALLGVLYGDEYYTSIDDFRTAWQSPDFKKYTPNMGGRWVETDPTGEGLPLEDRPPPMSVQPGGQRFKVDNHNKYVEWMDFSFYLTFTRDTGMRLYDIRFQGQRIIYELGLQEAIAHYAGNDPVQSGTSYLDSFYGFGPYAFSQVPGYDMPIYAHCLNTSFHASELSKSHRCGISIFETEVNHPIQRHSTQSYVSVTKNIALIVRSISTIGNYDYIFDYNFYLDGTIETVVRASGYIQTAYYAKNDDYGYHIHDGLSGSMHDHILNYKVDFDILGTSNTMVKHVFEPVEVQYKWHKSPRNTMHIVRKEVESEDDSKMNWSHNAQEQVLVVNKDATNQFGEPRGYKIMPSRGGAGIHLTIVNSNNLLNSAAFATNAYYVTKYKDNEMRSASAWNNYDTANPLINFDKFFDGDRLVQEDLVLWFNLGMHHVPHTGDLPNTVFTTAQSGMILTPHNYLSGDPSRQSIQQIRIDYDGDEVSDVYTFGSEPATGRIDLDDLYWNPYTYGGDVAVRKFPYDPQDPFGDTESVPYDGPQEED